MVYADLHVHTQCSDGTLTLSEVPAAARSAGVDVVAVTDHDRIHPDVDAPVVELADDGDGSVTVIRGIELRVESDAGRVDLLGYGLERTPALEAVVEHVQADRAERGQAIVECIEDRLGVDLGVEPRPGLGRPHIARAVADHPDTDLDYEGAFSELIGDGDPCYVPRDVPTFERGRAVLDGACGLVALAHPLRYSDPEGALALTADLDGVELSYPYGRPVDTAPVENAIAEHDLVATGGSDAHGHELGRAGLDRAAYERVRAAIAGA